MDAAEKGPAHYSAQRAKAFETVERTVYLVVGVCLSDLQAETSDGSTKCPEEQLIPRQCNWVHYGEWDRDEYRTVCMTRRVGGPAHPLQLLESGHDTRHQVYRRLDKPVTIIIMFHHRALSLQPEKGASPFPCEPAKIGQLSIAVLDRRK